MLITPNAVNLLKRIRVVRGKSNWSGYADFVDAERFVGHVREYTRDELARLGREVGLTDVRVCGENFIALWKRKYSRQARVVDKLLKLRPSFCSDLVMVGHKPR